MSNDLVRWFDVPSYLDINQQQVAQEYQRLAMWLDSTTTNGPELTVALRNLLNSREAALRAIVDLGPM